MTEIWPPSGSVDGDGRSAASSPRSARGQGSGGERGHHHPQGLDFKAEGELKLDEKTTPRSLNWYNFIGPGEQPLPEIAAVYKVDGDTFTVCNGGFHGARPREFKPGDSALADLVIFHRVGAKETDSVVHAQAVSAPPSPPVSDRAGSVSDVRPLGSTPSDRGRVTVPARSTTSSVAPLPMTTLNQTQYPANRRVKRRPIRSTISALLGSRRTAHGSRRPGSTLQDDEASGTIVGLRVYRPVEIAAPARPEPRRLERSGR